MWINLRISIQLQVPDFSSTSYIIKMVFDKSLHHTYMYVYQPYAYFCCYINLGHYLVSVLLVAVLGGDATFL